ncbi:amino acid adenylation domain-containing protein [Streptomyces fuscichromogenes]|uniref:amino acid adenylation domain-containing protein n=1 Tax=Streptomyces fuscichromogenes TaxID=1324013 RepID=UPI003829D83B
MVTLAERFRAQVAQYPDRVALAEDGAVRTYAQLLADAEAFASGLTRLGVRRGTLVGIAGGRSASFVTALVGTVLAGAGYVPLNPGHPAVRLRRIAAKADLGLVVRTGDGPGPEAAALPERTRLRTAAQVLDEGAADATLPVSDETVPAYVMFTSGSTGEPKGVVVGQAGVIRLVCGARYAGFRPEDRIAHGAAPEFDAATLEIWGALLNGAALHIADAETMARPALYAAFLRRERITFAWLTAPLFHRMAEHDPGMFARLRVLMTGGDVVSPKHAALALEHCPGLELYNGYGPTENTTFTTVHRVTRPVPEPIPIGRAIEATDLFVCDDRGDPVPDGTEGELWVAGAGVARGYLNDPELTATRFRDGRYRTGDRVTRDAAGVLHFHGRVDQQVKILGHLVEPAEVTAALRTLPGVRQAHTVARRDAAGEARLIAYAVTDGTGAGPLRSALARLLPGYLRPARLLVLDELPLGPTGKVDHSRLPEPDEGGRGDDGGPADAGKTAGEGGPGDTGRTADMGGPGGEGVPGGEDVPSLYRLWAVVLGCRVSELDPDSGFFDIGGDSLKLARLLDLIDRRMGRSLRFADAYEAGTLREMARRLQAAPAAVPAIPAGTGSTGPVHPSQRGLYALWQARPDSLAYNIPIRLDFEGPLDPERLRAALRTLVRRHDALRTRLFVDATGLRQQVLDDVELAWESVPPGDPDTELAGFVRSFDPAVPPLLRARLAGSRLYLDLHHLIADGVSVRVLVQQLLDLHEGEAEAAVRPAVRWLDAAAWCAERATRDHGYWVRELDGMPGAGTLVTDHPRSPRPGDAGARERRDPVAAALLTRAARSHRTTPFVVLLAAYATTLVRTGSATSLVVGAPMHGRSHPDLADTVGMFVTTVPVPVRITPGMSLAGLVSDLDATHRRALDRQHFAFDALAAGRGVRPGTRNPLFDAFLALQNIAVYAYSAGNLRARLELLPTGSPRFDLNLQVHDRPDRLVADLEYAGDLYTPDSAARLLDSVLAVAAELDTAPDGPVLRGPAVPDHADEADFDYGAMQ